MKIKLGVIFGGDSVEHEVSIITALQAMEYIDEEKYDIIPIYIAKDRTWYCGKMLRDIDVFKNFNDLKKYANKVMLVKAGNEFLLKKINGLFNKTVDTLDIAFPIVHGKGVEDGSLVGLLESIGIPYVGTSILGSAMGQDKVICKQIMDSEGIKTPKYIWFYDFEYNNDSNKIIREAEKLNYPLIVKPASLGSSIGIKRVTTRKELTKAIEEAIDLDEKIIIDECIENLLEVNCSVFGNRETQEVSCLDEILIKNSILTYEDKYVGESAIKGGSKGSAKLLTTGRIIPARITKKQEEEVIDLALKTFRALNLNNIVRIDFLINKKTKEIYVNEPNIVPGSFAFYLWAPKGKKYNQLLDEAITLAIKDYKKRSKKVTSFNTNLLQNFNGVKGLKGAKGKLKF